jgi:hypothetical protein
MARFIKFLAVAVLILALFFVSLVVWCRWYGKSVIERRASVVLNRPVSVEQVEVAFPWALRLTGLNIEGLLWADQAEIKGGLWSPAGALRLSRVELTRPVLTIHRSPDNQIIWSEDKGGSAVAGTGRSDSRPMNAVIDMLLVTDGQIHFPSHASQDDEPDLSLSGVRLLAKNVPLSGQPLDVGFEFWGKMEGDVPFAGDGLKGAGWINWPGRNMDATFGVVNPQGKVDLEVNLSSRNNAMTARGHIKTRRMSLKTGEKEDNAVEDVVLDAIRSAGLELNLDFSLSTKMDQWELRNIEFSGNLNASDEGKTAEELKLIGQQLYQKYGTEEKK